MTTELTPLDRLVRERIETEGPIRFSEVVELALYHPDDGFYSGEGRAGRTGDFLTSPEVGPLFGILVGRAIDREWDRCGRPERFTVIDAGAGPGTLARSVLAADLRCRAALDYLCVEVSPSQREAHPDGVTSLDRLPDGPITGVVVANELLDNLAFTPLRRIDGAWRGAVVDLDDRALVERYDLPVDPEVGLLVDADAGRAVHQHGAAEWLRHVLGSLLARGRVIAIDYCRDNSADVEIRTYAGHGRGSEPLIGLGSRDVTTDVDLPQLERATQPATQVMTQAAWLEELGIEELVEAGRAGWQAGAARGDLAALRARSRIREAEALTDPAGLGAFTVAEWEVD